MISFTCSCGHTGSCEDGLAGSAVECPHCGEKLRVPGTGRLPVVEPAAAVQASTAEFANLTKGESIARAEAERQSTPGWAWIFGILCLAIPVVALGGIVPVLVGFGAMSACFAIARAKTAAVPFRVGACLGVTILAWVGTFGFAIWLHSPGPREIARNQPRRSIVAPRSGPPAIKSLVLIKVNGRATLPGYVLARDERRAFVLTFANPVRGRLIYRDYAGTEHDVKVLDSFDPTESGELRVYEIPAEGAPPALELADPASVRSGVKVTALGASEHPGDPASGEVSGVGAELDVRLDIEISRVDYDLWKGVILTNDHKAIGFVRAMGQRRGPTVPASVVPFEPIVDRLPIKRK